MTTVVEPGAHEQTTEMAALAGLGSPKVAADPLYRPETRSYMGWEYTVTGGAREKSTHTGKAKVERTGKNGGELEPKRKNNTENTEYRSVYCVVWHGGINYGPLFVFDNWTQFSAQSRYFFFLLLWEILPGKLQRKGLGKEGFLVCAVVGRVFHRTQQEKRCGKSLRCCIFAGRGVFRMIFGESDLRNPL